jgi:hypothetical protein
MEGIAGEKLKPGLDSDHPAHFRLDGAEWLDHQLEALADDDV